MRLNQFFDMLGLTVVHFAIFANCINQQVQILHILKLTQPENFDGNPTS